MVIRIRDSVRLKRRQNREEKKLILWISMCPLLCVWWLKYNGGTEDKTSKARTNFPRDFLPTIKKRKTSPPLIFFTSENGSDDSREQTSSINGQIKDGEEAVSLFFL